MSSSTLKPVACRIPPITGPNASHSKVSRVAILNRQALPSLQFKEKEKPLLQERTTSVSRREMMHLAAASLGLLPVLWPASAEARTRNATMRQKIFEKLEELRRKAGLSKLKDEGEAKKPSDDGEAEKAKDEDMKSRLKEETKETKPTLNNGSEEKKPATIPQSTEPPNEEPALPALPNILNDKTVETTTP